MNKTNIATTNTSVFNLQNTHILRTIISRLLKITNINLVISNCSTNESLLFNATTIILGIL